MTPPERLTLTLCDECGQPVAHGLLCSYGCKYDNSAVRPVHVATYKLWLSGAEAPHTPRHLGTHGL